jgi:hypothetical protein
LLVTALQRESPEKRVRVDFMEVRGRSENNLGEDWSLSFFSIAVTEHDGLSNL